ncbi:MAG: hypothetical protein IJO61_00225 [Oscillospiraceae bacterium]|nr:hypothetical protein [Oscillospiraceae bacterium]MBQ6845531.1 hypothetical protein [Oscillospiraceae bacterium]
MKKFLKKATSLVVAFAIVAAFIPVSGLNASAAEVGDTVTFDMTITACQLGTEGVDWQPNTSDKNRPHPRSLTNYVDGTTSRNWKYYADNVINGTNSEIAFSASVGIYFDGNKQNAWVALKVRGVDAGSYDLALLNVTSNYKGCIYDVYILDDDIYGNATGDEITSALDNNSVGVTKVGRQDVYQNTVEKIDFGTANIKKTKSGDVMVVVRAVEKSTQEKVTGNTNPSAYFINLKGLTFTYTGGLPAQNEETFGSSAAFFEKTENGDCNVYLVSAIDSLDYINAGFKVAVDGGASETIMTETVYQKITVDGEEYDATDFGLSDGYLFVAKKTLAAFTGQDIDFKPFATAASGEVAGSTYCATLSGGNE